MNAREVMEEAIRRTGDPELKIKYAKAKEEARLELAKGQLSAAKWIETMKSKPLPFILVLILGFAIGWFAKTGA